MHYDPIKDRLNKYINKNIWFRVLFYKLLDLLLLRTWHIHRELRKWAKNKRDNPMHILDAGSGFGQYSYYISRMSKNWSTLSIDVKKDQIADCNNLFRKLQIHHTYFKTGDLLQLEDKEGFDLVLCVDVMEHIEDDVRVFKNFYHCLRPDGMLLISTPSDLGGSDVKEVGGISFIEEHVRNGYNIHEIKEKLQQSGFQKVKARYSYGTLGSTGWLLSMKIPVMMLGKSKWFFVLLPFYYLITYPVAFVLNWIDVHAGHTSGTGLIVKAWKVK